MERASARRLGEWEDLARLAAGVSMGTIPGSGVAQAPSPAFRRVPAEGGGATRQTGRISRLEPATPMYGRIYSGRGGPVCPPLPAPRLPHCRVRPYRHRVCLIVVSAPTAAAFASLSCPPLPAPYSPHCRVRPYRRRIRPIVVFAPTERLSTAGPRNPRRRPCLSKRWRHASALPWGRSP